MFNQGDLDIFIIGPSSTPGQQCESMGFANVFYIALLFLVQNYSLYVVFNKVGGERLRRVGAGIGTWRVSFSYSIAVEITGGVKKIVRNLLIVIHFLLHVSLRGVEAAEC